MASPIEEQDEQFSKALGQYRLALNGLMHPLRLYGQQHYVDQVIEELVQLAVRLHYRLCYEDVPFEYREIHW